MHTHTLIHLMDECCSFHTTATGTKCSILGEERECTVDTNSCRCGHQGDYKFPLNLVSNGVVFFQ